MMTITTTKDDDDDDDGNDENNNYGDDNNNDKGDVNDKDYFHRDSLGMLTAMCSSLIAMTMISSTMAPTLKPQWRHTS
jgi:hypothetical protein